MRSVGAIAVVALLCACNSSVVPGRFDTLTVRACVGPALSLPATLEASLPPRTGLYQPDDKWADLASQVPGGFAGVFFENPGQKPILMLTRPAEAAEAKAALAGELPGFPVQNAEVREARWDFLQLVDWFRYLFSQPGIQAAGVNLGDKNEVLNRIVFGAETESEMAALETALLNLDVPCDLVRVVQNTPPVALDKTRLLP